MSSPPMAAHRPGPRRLLIAGAILATAAAAVLLGGLVELPDLDAWLISLSQALGPWTYPLVGGLAFLETGAFVGLMVPGETTVVLGGAIAARGDVALPAVMGVAWAGAALGDLVSYLLGRRLGRRFLVAHGPRLRVTPERLARVERFFDRYSGPTVLIGRFVGIVRAVAPFLAGAARLPLRRFLPYSLLGTGLYAAAFTTLGYVFARSFAEAATTASRLILAAAILIAGVLLLRAHRRRRRPPVSVSVGADQSRRLRPRRTPPG